MSVHPSQFGDLIFGLRDENPLIAYQSAVQLELLKSKMDDWQREQCQSALAAASQQLQAARKAQQETEQAKLDEWDKKDDRW
ncbi:hypothetical protein NT239_06205 [Chitinibacter sp. SCUT-21]|uniref:hypothetical protein n=1 Tax=Chitinibacter sp. SCUT-21 TaxID=2970891 RepID=UPI0035A6CEC1